MSSYLHFLADTIMTRFGDQIPKRMATETQQQYIPVRRALMYPQRITKFKARQHAGSQRGDGA